jgi:predicted aldo/keto reductase-like oxidoreductase
MLYRKVPKNGDKLSVLGYGCMRLPVKMQSINEKLAEKQILYAKEKGANDFDTAVPYHKGYGRVDDQTDDLAGQANNESQEKNYEKIAEKAFTAKSPAI